MMLIGKEVQLPAVEVVLVRCLTPGCGKRETELVNVDIGIPAAAAWFGLSCLRFTRIYIRTLKQATKTTKLTVTAVINAESGGGAKFPTKQLR